MCSNGLLSRIYQLKLLSFYLFQRHLFIDKPMKFASFLFSAHCSNVMCAMYCEHGFQVGADGCETCKCNQPRKSIISESYIPNISTIKVLLHWNRRCLICNFWLLNLEIFSTIFRFLTFYDAFKGFGERWSFCYFITFMLWLNTTWYELKKHAIIDGVKISNEKKLMLHIHNLSVFVTRDYGKHSKTLYI